MIVPPARVGLMRPEGARAALNLSAPSAEHHHNTLGGHHVTRLWRAARTRIGHRGAALLFFALVNVVYAAGLFFVPPETAAADTYRFFASLLPLSVWATVWAAAGLLCAVQAFQRSDRLAFAAASALNLAWGITHLIGWLAADVSRGYVSAAIWLAFAGFVQVIATWREPDGER